ncbi:hypothetical protein AgCh_014828 [Apium graveolens]
MFVVIISKNYARSPWCLKELADILSCKETENQVIPVFYYVDPSDVRHRKGSFGDALDYHYQTKRYSPDMIDEWKSALAQIAALSGYHLKKEANENEAETIQKIVDNIVPQVSTKVLYLGEELFGMDSVVKRIYQKLQIESSDQLLASLLRRKDCKVPDVDSGIRQLGQILFSKKALVVLDNLDQSSCSEFLARYFSLFSVGSRIVVTTRDVNLLNQLNQVHVDIYMVDELGEVDSLKLFNYHSFGKVTPPANLENLSKSFVTYAGCLPLALKVLGSSLRGRTQDEVFWKAKLEKVRKILENGIMEILQLSYNELNDDTVKSIFLDIAFFFVGKYKNDAFYIFQSCDYFPEDGIQVLLDRCLITIDENNKFEMHDLIQDMGWAISKSTRLFLRGNAWEYLKNQKELHKVEGLILDLTQCNKIQIDSQLFEMLPNLRLLELFNAHSIKGHFKNSFQELRCIYWSNCMWTQLPSSFQPRKLISFQMQSSNFKMLWNDARPFTSLKILNVGYSRNLKTTPNFGNSISVTELYFQNCKSLRKVHPSIRELTGLHVLNLKKCIKLKVLAETLGQSSRLAYLYLGYCSNVRQLPKQMGSMGLLKRFDASYTAIEELPDSITQLKELVYLKLDGCVKLKKLPEQIGNMVGLRKFCASFSAIEQLPDSFAGLVNLEILDMRGCNKLRNLPNSIWKLQLLQVLDMGYCSKLKRLPNELEKMQCLEELDASYTDIEEVPDSIGLLSTLRVLDLSCCEKLKHLPGSVWNLTSVTHLKIFQKNIDRINLPDEVKNTKLVTLALNCDIMLWLPVILSFSSLKDLTLCDRSESSSSTKTLSLSKLYNLRYLSLYICTRPFPELPLSITRLSLNDDFTLVHLPDLSSLKKLKNLVIYRYFSLKSLPPLPHLQSLTLYDCRSLQHLSDMSMLKELSDLQYGKLKSVGSRDSLFEVIDEILPLYEVEVPKTAEWLNYKSSGSTVSFDIPKQLADNFLGVEGEVYSVVKCIRGDEISIRSGDNIKISLGRSLDDLGEVGEGAYEEVKMD